MRLAILFVAIGACGGDPVVGPDASFDAGRLRDAGSIDAGSMDAGSIDAGSIDGGMSDAGFVPSPANVGWIGGACESAADCFDVSGAVCLRDGYPSGLCTTPCTATCPDRGGASDTLTFCIDGVPHGFEDGICVSRCDPALLPPNGCADGYRCVEQHRYGDPYTVIGACVPDLPSSCPGWSDELIELPYPDRGAVWIPAEAGCEIDLDLLVMLHGINASSNPTPSLGGGRRLELLVRSYIDAGLIRPLMLAEPVHFEGSSIGLYGAGFDPAEHLSRVQAILDARGILVRTLSYVGHSGAGCNANNGLYEVLDRYGDLVGTFAPSMRLWGLMDTCYGGAYHYDAPLAVLSGQDVVIASMFTTGSTVAEWQAFEAGLFASPQPLSSCRSIYSSCVRDSAEHWCSYRTSVGSAIIHNTNPWFYFREVLPRVFSPDSSVEPCR